MHANPSKTAARIKAMAPGTVPNGKSRHTPVGSSMEAAWRGARDRAVSRAHRGVSGFSTISIGRVQFRTRLTCMSVRFKYIPAYDGGNSTSSYRHKATACRVHGYGV